VSASESALRTLYAGWADHERLLVTALRDLTPDELALRAASHQWAVWQMAAHVAGSRAFWFHDVLGEGDRAVRDMFRVERTTVPGLSLDDAGWEDDETRPRAGPEIVEALERTWAMIEACLARWTPDDLMAGFRREGYEGVTTRAWAIWHLIEHEGHHGGEISLILGSNGLAGLDL